MDPLDATHPAAAPLATATRIVRVEAIPVRLSYRRPGRFASGEITVADNVLVRIHSDSGHVGIAEAQPRPYTYGGTQESMVASIERDLAPRLHGIDPMRRELLASRADVPGADRVARGALDIAIWDLCGKELGVPVHRLLGGFADAVPVAHMVSFDTPEEMAADAVEAFERFGVLAFKVKVGRDPELDVAAVRAVREALPDAGLYVDANRGWSVEQALAATPGLLELGVIAIEEPIDVTDTEGRRRLAEAWPVPLVGDESCTSLPTVRAALHEGAVSQVCVKAARTGFSESRRIVGLCDGVGVPVVVGSQYEGAIGAFASIALAASSAATAGRPAEVTNFADLHDDLVVAPPDITGGHAVLPATPGLGALVDDERLTHHRIDR
ncbi:mandelate racemase/muconate lactonizing enzyme family protein [Patulibacter minatonensis]|uniref:mandelate racemase/muconate lactonizing enzyme family protein n=1 Tax=Patulibacter minatonensis TaxID=298163 RepID=UPI0004AF8A1D|nr:enolase C-terminal domain-like protein [Patulibacter minatonensis]